MGCATGTVKTVMFLFNLAFVVGGILMIVAGSLVLTGHRDYHEIVEISVFKATPILSIILGSVVFLIAFLGCCGVLRHSNCMLLTYAVILAVLLMGQIAIAVTAGLQEDKFKERLTTGLQESMRQYDISAKLRESWDSMQMNLKCCGTETYSDWSTFGNRDNVPESCCKERYRGCAENVLSNQDKIYSEGCASKALRYTKYIIIAAAVIAGVELVGIVFACCLSARFRRKDYNYGGGGR